MIIGDKTIFAIEFESCGPQVWRNGPKDLKGYCFYWLAGHRLGDTKDGPSPLLSWISTLRHFMENDRSNYVFEWESLPPEDVVVRAYREIWLIDHNDQLEGLLQNRLLAPDGNRSFDLVFLIVLDLGDESVIFGVDEVAARVLWDTGDVHKKDTIVMRMPKRERVEIMTSAIEAFSRMLE